MASGGAAAVSGTNNPGFVERLREWTDTDARPLAPHEIDDAESASKDVLEPDDKRKREKFIPVTRFAIFDRLTKPDLWPEGMAADARRLFRYLGYWRQQKYNSMLIQLEQTYEAFSPDTDLLITRKFSDTERKTLQREVMQGVETLLKSANYERIDPTDVELIMTRDSHYGLDLFVDMGDFEEIVIYYRGASNRKYQRRTYAKFLKKERFDVPTFQRLFIMFKLKPVEERVKELMKLHGCSEEKARAKVRRQRERMPATITENNIYLKLFKNIPRTDIEMIFPNSQVRFRAMDKLRLGLTASSGLGMGIVGSAGKLALLVTNPLAAAGAVAGLGTIAARQAVGFMHQRTRYMVVMAQNLYFHTLADNRGVILKIAARGAEEDVKEEMLLYSVLAKEPASRADLPAIDLAIENYLYRTFGARVDFDVEDALDRLIADGIVTEDANGNFYTLPPDEAALLIDEHWDKFLDNLPDPVSAEGYEFEGTAGAQSS